MTEAETLELECAGADDADVAAVDVCAMVLVIAITVELCIVDLSGQLATVEAQLVTIISDVL